MDAGKTCPPRTYAGWLSHQRTGTWCLKACANGTGVPALICRSKVGGRAVEEAALLQVEEESTGAWVLWQRGNCLYISPASTLMEDKMAKARELTFSPFGPGGPIGPGGPACPCGEQTACEETGRGCLTEGSP